MKKHLSYLLFLAAICLIATSCSKYSYYAVGSNSAGLSKYSTFAWLPPMEKDNAIYNDIADEKIKDETTAQLEQRGLTLKARQPDLLVRYTIMVDDKVKTYNNPQYDYVGGGYYPRVLRYRGGRYLYYNYSRPFPVYMGDDIERVPYKQGTLLIDLIDRSTRKVIWRGYGVGEIKNEQSAINDIAKVVDGIINKLPINRVK